MKNISILKFITQLYFFLTFVKQEGFLIKAMVHEVYITIWSPLLYNIAMSQRVCSKMMVLVNSLGLFGDTLHTTCMTMLSSCGSYIVSHYFCGVLFLLSLSCSITHINGIVLFIIGGINTLVPTMATIMSYAFILTSILASDPVENVPKPLAPVVPIVWLWESSLCL